MYLVSTLLVQSGDIAIDPRQILVHRDAKFRDDCVGLMVPKGHKFDHWSDFERNSHDILFE